VATSGQNALKRVEERAQEAGFMRG